MSLSLDVYLLSGKSASLEVEADASVETLQQCARSALVAGKGRLLNASGEVLDGAKTITEAKLQSGDVLTLHVNPVQLRPTRQAGAFCAFAALLGDRSVVTWGNADHGDDSSAVAEECAADSSFARSMCCNSGRWICGHLKQVRPWWQ